MNHFGLTKKDIAALQSIFQRLPEIQEVIIFGSRAKGNSKNGSDIDLAVKGKNMNDSVISHIHTLLEEETPLPSSMRPSAGASVPVPNCAKTPRTDRCSFGAAI